MKAQAKSAAAVGAAFRAERSPLVPPEAATELADSIAPAGAFISPITGLVGGMIPPVGGLSGQQRSVASTGPSGHGGAVMHELQETPLPRMKTKAGVARIEDRPSISLGAGVRLWRATDRAQDPEVSIDQLALDHAAHAKLGPYAQTLRLTLDAGTASVWIDGQPQALAAGDLLTVPPGTKLRLDAGPQGATLSAFGLPHCDFRKRPGATPSEARLERAAQFVEKEQGNGEGCFIIQRLNEPAVPGGSIAQARVAPGAKTALHTLSSDERYLISEGQGLMQLGDQQLFVRPGDVVSIPKRVAQRIQNVGPHDLVFQCLCTPRFTPAAYAPAEEVALKDVDPSLQLRAVVPAFDGQSAPAHVGKRAVVTGATRGIGLETCRQLAHQGFSVVLTGRDPAAGQQAVADLAKEGLKVEFRRLDVTDPESVARFAADPILGGSLDVLVNNAGICLDAPGQVVADRAAMEHLTLETNFRGPERLTTALLPLLLHSSSTGRVINLSSRLATKGWVGQGWDAYRDSKRLLGEWTQALSQTVPLAVNAVNPGWVKTQMGGAKAPDSINDGVQAILWLATTEAPPQAELLERTPGIGLPSGHVAIARRGW